MTLVVMKPKTFFQSINGLSVLPGANLAGFTGLAYLAMFSIPIYETEKKCSKKHNTCRSIQLTILIPNSERFNFKLEM